MGAGNLTSLAAVKQWLSITTEDTDADELLNRLIRAASTFVLSFLNRTSLGLATYSEVYDGYGNSFMVLRQSPVYAVDGMSFAGTAINAATGNGFTNPYTNGFTLEPEYSPYGGGQRVNLYGHRFPNARGSISVRYQAGYVMPAEPHTIPDDDPWQVSTDFRWLSDVSVRYAGTGVLFTKVASNPVEHEYSVDADGLYTFAAADAGEDILIAYSFVPADIEQAVWELVGERYRYMDRIGYVSKSLGGQETVTFAQGSMSSYLRDLLTPYKNVVPV